VEEDAVRMVIPVSTKGHRLRHVAQHLIQPSVAPQHQ
jgi:hypothetical protein